MSQRSTMPPPSARSRSLQPRYHNQTLLSRHFFRFISIFVLDYLCVCIPSQVLNVASQLLEGHCRPASRGLRRWRDSSLARVLQPVLSPAEDGASPLICALVCVSPSHTSTMVFFSSILSNLCIYLLRFIIPLAVFQACYELVQVIV